MPGLVKEDRLEFELDACAMALARAGYSSDADISYELYRSVKQDSFEDQPLGLSKNIGDLVDGQDEALGDFH